jgi:hypothetical protein
MDSGELRKLAEDVAKMRPVPQDVADKIGDVVTQEMEIMVASGMTFDEAAKVCSRLFLAFRSVYNIGVGTGVIESGEGRYLDAMCGNGRIHNN